MIMRTEHVNGLWVIHLLIAGEREEVVSKRSYLEALSLAVRILEQSAGGMAA